MVGLIVGVSHNVPAEEVSGHVLSAGFSTEQKGGVSDVGCQAGPPDIPRASSSENNVVQQDPSHAHDPWAKAVFV